MGQIAFENCHCMECGSIAVMFGRSFMGNTIQFVSVIAVLVSLPLCSELAAFEQTQTPSASPTSQTRNGKPTTAAHSDTKNGGRKPKANVNGAATANGDPPEQYAYCKPLTGKLKWCAPIEWKDNGEECSPGKITSSDPPLSPPISGGTWIVLCSKNGGITPRIVRVK
jgi:hypothetical protein